MVNGGMVEWWMDGRIGLKIESLVFWHSSSVCSENDGFSSKFYPGTKRLIPTTQTPQKEEEKKPSTPQKKPTTKRRRESTSLCSS
jgi:hypothetical protein